MKVGAVVLLLRAASRLARAKHGSQNTSLPELEQDRPVRGAQEP